MTVFPRVLFFAILPASLALLAVGCKPRRESASGVKDVVYVDQTLADKFAFVEVCSGPWESTPDAQCKVKKVVNGAMEKEIASDRIYLALDLSIPAGALGANELARKKARVDQIGPADARREAQRVLDGLQQSYLKKNEMKRNLAEGTTGATCFADAAGTASIGGSGITCARLDALIADDGVLWSKQNGAACLVRYAGDKIGTVLTFSRELKLVRLEEVAYEIPFAELSPVDGACSFLPRL